MRQEKRDRGCKIHSSLHTGREPNTKQRCEADAMSGVILYTGAQRYTYRAWKTVPEGRKEERYD